MTVACSIKPSLYCKQHHWQTNYPVARLNQWLDKQRAHDIETGQVNLYVSNSVRDENGKIGLFLYLDIEAAGQHDDIAANINAAQDAYLWIQEHNLSEGLRVMCTGRGFRFCWPFLISPKYTSAFKDLVADIPHAEKIEPRKFTRIIGYRGNIAQGKQNFIDASIRLLNDPADVMTLTEGAYKALVAGPVGKEEAKTTLQAIVPTESIPDTWLVMLQDYQRRRKIKNSAIQPPRRERRGNYLPQIFSELDGRGITYREIKDGIYRLNECPICGRKNTNPFVTAAGRLKCWTTNCDAGRRNEQGDLVGLGPHEWIDGLSPESDTDSQDPAKKSSTTVDQSRQMIQQAVQSQRNIAVRVTPGAGKTHTTLQTILSECQGKTIVYAEPTIAKVHELFEAAQAMPEAAGVEISIIRGRTDGTPEKNHTDRNCHRFSEADRIAKKGFKPGFVLCPRCAHKPTCKYWKQFEVLDRPGLIITTHEQAVNLPPVDDLIFDENPETTLLKSESVTFDALKQFRVGGGELVKNLYLKMDRLIDDLAETAVKDKRGIVIQHIPTEDDKASLFDAAQITQKEADALRSHLAAYQRFPDETLQKYHRRLYRDNVNMRALTWLLVALDEVQGRACIKVSHSGRYGMEYTLMRQVDPDGRIIVLDGTAFPPALEKLFSRQFEQVEATVDLSDVKTVHYKRGLGITKLRKLGQPEIERLLKKSVDELPITSKKLLICTWKDMEPIVAAAAANVFPRHYVQTIHFMQSRGLNQYKDCDAAILFGTFTINQVESGKRAELLFPDDEQTRNKYRLNLSAAENIQSVHRVRPVNGDKTLIVYGREWLPEIPGPNVISDLRKGGDEAFEEAYRRAKAFYGQHGFFYRHIGWLLGFGYRTERSQVKSFHNKVYKTELFSLIGYNLLGKIPEKCRLLMLNDPKYYDRIINRLRQEFPSAPELQTTQTANGQPAIGIGTIKQVKRFFFRLGTLSNFDSARWVEIPVAPELPEPEFVGDSGLSGRSAEVYALGGQRGPPG